MEIEFNAHKFHELMLYIAERSETDPRFGATKLNTLLFYIDFGGYRVLGAPVAGATYQHLPAGPAPREMLTARRYLLDSGAASMEIRSYFASTQERLKPRRDADLRVFSPQERTIIDNVIDEFWNYNARSISAHSHEEWGWRVTKDFDDIPYSSAWVSSDPLTPDQVMRGREVAAEHGLQV